MQTAKAEADLAYSLSAAKLMYEIKRNDKEVDVIERRKLAEIESYEVQRNTLELQSVTCIQCMHYLVSRLYYYTM